MRGAAPLLPVVEVIKHIDIHPILDTRISSVLRPPSGSGDPPRILKRAGLESSGRRLISSIGKTKENSIIGQNIFLGPVVLGKVG